MKPYLSLYFILVLVLLSCEKDNNTNQPSGSDLDYCTNTNRFSDIDTFSVSDVASETNVLYGQAEDWQGNLINLEFDVYYPNDNVENLENRPAILLIHGGGFINGSKEGWADECVAFAKKGFVAITMSYRLGWDTSNPENRINAIYRAQQDANAAMRYIVHNASDYNIDSNRLFIGGGSAGAITALNVTYGNQEDWNTFIPNIQVENGSLNGSGNNLIDQFSIKGVFNNWGATFIDFVQSSEMRPLISFHGDMDATVSIDEGEFGLSGSRVLTNLLNENDVCTDFTIQINGGHGIYTTTSGRQFRVDRATCFFKSIMCNSCDTFYSTEQVLPTCSNP